MICVFIPSEDFTLAGYGELLNQQYRRLCDIFPGSAVEFFYYLKPTVAETYLILRVEGAEKNQFIEAVETFSESTGFSYLSRVQRKVFFERTESLDSYV